MRRESWSMTVDCKRLRQELSQQNNMLQFSLTASRRWKPDLCLMRHYGNGTSAPSLSVVKPWNVRNQPDGCVRVNARMNAASLPWSRLPGATFCKERIPVNRKDVFVQFLDLVR